MNKACPLCDGPATMISVDHENANKVYCKICGDYLITNVAIKRLNDEFSGAKDGFKNKVIDIDLSGNHADIRQEVGRSGKSLSINELNPEEFEKIK